MTSSGRCLAAAAFCVKSQKLYLMVGKKEPRLGIWGYAVPAEAFWAARELCARSLPYILLKIKLRLLLY